MQKMETQCAERIVYIATLWDDLTYHWTLT